MAVVEQQFEGTPGANITTATSDYDLVNPSNSVQVTFSDAVADPMGGTTVGRFVGAAGVVGEVRYNRGTQNSGAQRIVARFTGVPTSASCDIAQTRGTVQHSGIRFHTAGDLRILNLGSEIPSQFFTPTLNTWYVIDLVAIQGTTTSNGTIKARYRELDALGTVLFEHAPTNRNVGVVGTDNINSYRIGKITSTANMPEFFVASHIVSDGATDYIEDPIVSNAGSDQLNVEPGQTITLSGFGTGPWTQTAGPTVTLYGSGSVRTFEAPWTLSGATLTFTYGSDSMDVTVLPATRRIVLAGGTEAPVKRILI